MEFKRCYNCRFWATKAVGLSDYTVENVTVHCLKKHFEPADEHYSWKKEENPENDHAFFKQAENCADFKKGKGIHIPVEEAKEALEEYKEKDHELYALWHQKI